MSCLVLLFVQETVWEDERRTSHLSLNAWTCSSFRRLCYHSLVIQKVSFHLETRGLYCIRRLWGKRHSIPTALLQRIILHRHHSVIFQLCLCSRTHNGLMWVVEHLVCHSFKSSPNDGKELSSLSSIMALRIVPFWVPFEKWFPLAVGYGSFPFEGVVAMIFRLTVYETLESNMFKPVTMLSSIWTYGRPVTVPVVCDF